MRGQSALISLHADQCHSGTGCDTARCACPRRLIRRAWRGAYRGIIPHLPLERMIARRGQAWWERALEDRYPLLLLDFGGEPAGYATFGRSRLRHTPAQGEIFELYLHPVYQGLGLGRRLFDATASACSIVATKTSWCGRLPTMTALAASILVWAASRSPNAPSASIRLLCARSRSPGGETPSSWIRSERIHRNDLAGP